MEDRGGAPAVAHNASPAGVRDESVVPVPPRVRSDLNRGRNAPRRGRALPPDVRGPATRRLRTATRAMERPGAPERVPSAARLPRTITLNCDASGVKQNAAEGGQRKFSISMRSLPTDIGQPNRNTFRSGDTARAMLDGPSKSHTIRSRPVANW